MQDLDMFGRGSSFELLCNARLGIERDVTPIGIGRLYAAFYEEV